MLGCGGFELETVMEAILSRRLETAQVLGLETPRRRDAWGDIPVDGALWCYGK
jgi:hypothetical protein